MYIGIAQIKKMYDFGRQYDVFGKWLMENGCALKDLPLTTKNEFGEDVTIEAQIQEDGIIVWKTTTIQRNHWNRIDYYYPDGIVEEMYEK